METIRVFEAFAGYGSQAVALERLGIPHKVVGISEIDKYATQAYMAVHGDTPNYGDISKIDWSKVPDFDFFTYSFPCTDISNAGKQAGLTEGSGTRSSLIWECRRAIEAKKPRWLMLENVKQLVGKKFRKDFDKWLDYLKGLGYSNFWQVLNAKDYGIPQNRERVFVISILDENASYSFPEKMPLKLRLKDMLEEKVDEKRYMKPEQIQRIIVNSVRVPECNKEPKILVCGKINSSQDGVVVHPDGIAKCLTSGHNNCPKIIEPLRIKQATKKGYVEVPPGAVFDGSYPDSKTRRGRLQEGGKVSPTITSQGEPPCYYEGLSTTATIQSPDRYKGLIPLWSTDRIMSVAYTLGYRIRKLTPRECFRLMGMDDARIDKIQAAGISNCQQYKMAGNSIVVDVILHIFKNLFIDQDLIDILGI